MRSGVVSGLSRASVASSLIKAVPLSQRRVPRAGVGTQISTQVTPFTPLDLFAQGEAGFWYDFSDPTTMFQDVAGTVPVESFGDPVALVLDKSGNGYHATQETNAARPIWTHDAATGLVGISFDGVDDRLDTPVIAELQDATAAHVSIGIRLTGFAVRNLVRTDSRGFGLSYVFEFGAEGVNTNNIPSFITIVDDGVGSFQTRTFDFSFRLPLLAVLSLHAEPSFAYRQFRVNGRAFQDLRMSPSPTRVFDARSVRFTPGASFMTHAVYRVAAPSAQETQQLEQWIGQRTGLVP